MVNDPLVAEEKYVFMRCCRAVDIISLAKRGAMPLREGGRRLKTAHAAYMAEDQRLHGDANTKPKTHWAFDVAELLEMQGADVGSPTSGVGSPTPATGAEFLFDTFMIERPHLKVKAASQHCNTRGHYEVTG